ncbi:DUF4145 domain-containing protein [Tateyamaria sp.]|uniref:DUF4145 domain-containing protein n=1 Tax=Tateyamaria sp. TaxID=1929288 RepID=UPI00329DD59D
MPNTPFNWSCRYCGQATTITDSNFDSGTLRLDIAPGDNAAYSFKADAICCPNPECQKVSLTATLHENGWVQNIGSKSWRPVKVLNDWSLLPRSSAKPMPDFVPEEIRNNYLEACLIQEDSPKASAAMSRRCLQGMVRDFWNIPATKRGNLGAEISYISEKVDADTLDSIKAVREVGDIGAHMEKAVDTIVDVEPEEAGLLIELIETLVSDWYIAKHRRAHRNKALQEAVAIKREAKKISKENLKQIEDQSNEDT